MQVRVVRLYEDKITNECKESYRHFKHEVLLTKAEADICNRALEEAGWSQHQHKVQVSREWGLRQREMISAWQTHKDRPP